MEEIKEAFGFVKKDIAQLYKEINFLKKEFGDLQESVLELGKILKKFYSEKKESSHNNLFHLERNKPTEGEDFSSLDSLNKTDKKLFKPLNGQIKGISIGNEGVQTDRQTNQQTDRQLGNTLNEATKALNSIEVAKSELTNKIKKLTEKETDVFLAIYQLEDQGERVNYKLLSEKLSLTESSIRDYVRRLIFKGIPLEKTKENNKEIYVSIAPNLRKLANISTLLQLRGV